MVVILKELFIDQLAICPIIFQEKFRKVYQQLKIVDSPLEIKAIQKTKDKDFFKLFIDKSRIGLHTRNKEVRIVCFLYNQFFDGELET